MVGVPGRSKGCNTCRRRRVKCDEAKPVCQRCTKAGFECLGYQRPSIWHHTSTAPFPEQAESSSAASGVSGTSAEAAFAIITAPCGVSGGETAGTAETWQSSGSHKTPTDLTLVAFPSDFAALEANFVHRAFGGRWLADTLAGKLDSLSLDTATALAQASYGRAYNEPEMYVAGITRYGTCLQSLAANLAAGGGREQLVPALLCTMVTTLDMDLIATTAHLQGIARLLHVCGPRTFQHEPYLSAFESARSILIIASLIGRQRLFLDSSRWRSVPWTRHPNSKSQENILLDILVSVPGILQDHIEALAAGNTVFPTLCNRAHALLVQLYRWRWTWQASHGDGRVSIDSKNNELSFRRFESAFEYMVYNTVLLWLLALVWKLDPAGAPAALARAATEGTASASSAAMLSSCPLPLPGHITTLRSAAVEICRAFAWISTHHHLRRRATDQALFYLFPIGMAMSVLADDADPAIRSWPMDLLAADPVTANYGADGNAPYSNVAGLGFYATPERLNPLPVEPAYMFFAPEEVSAMKEH